MEILDFAKLQNIKSDNETLEGDFEMLMKEEAATPKPSI
jgi:hypothetical protein